MHDAPGVRPAELGPVHALVPRPDVRPEDERLSDVHRQPDSPADALCERGDALVGWLQGSE